MKPYHAIVFLQRECPDCDSQNAGHFERLDCGCVWGYKILSGPFAKKILAAIIAAKIASRRYAFGVPEKGFPTGHWTVETEAGVVLSGQTTEKKR